jgi:hypothetical protein
LINMVKKKILNYNFRFKFKWKIFQKKSNVKKIILFINIFRKKSLLKKKHSNKSPNDFHYPFLFINLLSIIEINFCKT